MNFNFPEQTLSLPVRYPHEEIGMNDTTLGSIIDEINFLEISSIDNADEIENYLSPCFTFFDGINFYYDEKVMELYENRQQCAIIVNEIINFLGLYHTTNREIDDYRMEKIKSETLVYLYAAGLTLNKVPYSQSIRSDMVNIYIQRFGKLDVPLFAPNRNAVKYLFNGMMQGYDGVIKFLPGCRLENEDYVYVDAFSLYLHMSKDLGLCCNVKGGWDHKSLKYNYSHRIFVYDKKNQRLTRKKSDEYVDFIDAIEMMKKLTF